MLSKKASERERENFENDFTANFFVVAGITWEKKRQKPSRFECRRTDVCICGFAVSFFSTVSFSD